MPGEFHVAWCKECQAMGVVINTRLPDTAVEWANMHHDATKHGKIASMSYNQLKDLYETATKVIDESREDLMYGEH